MRTNTVALLFCTLSACGTGLPCTGPECSMTGPELERLQGLSPIGPPLADPTNVYADLEVAARLGQRLYFDTALSGVAVNVDALGRPIGAPSRAATGERIAVSCATCHDPTRGGSDHTSGPAQVAIGAGWAPVNALSNLYADYFPLQFWNGRADSTWGLVPGVIEGELAMNGSRVAVFRRVASTYAQEFTAIFPADVLNLDLASLPLEGKPGQPAYDRLDEATKTKITQVLVYVAKALAAYQRYLPRGNSAFDRYMAGELELSPAAVRGARLFVGRAGCIECHNTPLFSDGRFYNLGVPQLGLAVPREGDCPAGSSTCDCVTPTNCLPFGYFDGLRRLQQNKQFRRDGNYSDAPADTSRGSYYSRPPVDTDKGAFRVPTLRNVALTGPYMHNGVFATLEEVVRFYNYGGGEAGAAPQFRSPSIRPLFLEDGDIQDLVAFLSTLSDAPLPASFTSTTTR